MSEKNIFFEYTNSVLNFGKRLFQRSGEHWWRDEYVYLRCA